MRNLLIIIFFTFFVASSDGQTLAKWWHGKHKEKFFITIDSSSAEFSPFGFPSERYDLKITNDSAFSLGLVTWRSVTIPNSKHSDSDYDLQRTEKLVDWFPFRILMLNADTLIIKYATHKRIDPQHFQSVYLNRKYYNDVLMLFSNPKIDEIRKPTFISLSFDMGGYCVEIDSSGFVKHWFDEASTARIAPGEIVKGKLTDIKFNELKYLFRSEEIQELPEHYGSAADGRHTVLKIRAFPRDIISTGSGTGDYNSNLWKLFKLLYNISEMLSAGQ